MRLSTSNVGNPDMSGIMGRRLQRELQKVKPGDAVELRVWQGGQFKTVRLLSQDREQAFPGRLATTKVTTRASIGATIGGSTSPRDTIGVFVASVVENGPLAKAGIYEGSRRPFDGVDLRMFATDAGDDMIATTRVNRLMRQSRSSSLARKWSCASGRTANTKT